MEIDEIVRLYEKESDRANKQKRLHPPHTIAIPVQFPFLISRAISEIQRNSDGQSMVRQRPVFLGQGLPRPVDAWKMREEFLSLKHTDAELRKFLDKYGRWNSKAGPMPVDSFWDFQEWLRVALLWPDKILGKQLSQTGFKGLPGLFAIRLSADFDYSDGMPKFVLNTSGCEDAIIASVQCDLARGKRFEKCARKGCDVIFEISSEHERKYCSPKCQHAALVTRQREKQRRKKMEVRTK